MRTLPHAIQSLVLCLALLVPTGPSHAQEPVAAAPVLKVDPGSGLELRRGTLDTGALEMLMYKRLKRLADEMVEDRIRDVFGAQSAALRLIVEDAVRGIGMLRGRLLLERLAADYVILSLTVSDARLDADKLLCENEKPRSFEDVRPDIETIRSDLQHRVAAFPEGGEALDVPSMSEKRLLSEVAEWLERAGTGGYCGRSDLWTTLIRPDRSSDMQLRWLLLDASFVDLMTILFHLPEDGDSPVHVAAWIRRGWGMGMAAVRATVERQFIYLKASPGDPLSSMLIGGGGQDPGDGGGDSQVITRLKGPQKRFRAAEAYLMLDSVLTPGAKELPPELRSAWTEALNGFGRTVTALAKCAADGPSALSEEFSTTDGSGFRESGTRVVALAALWRAVQGGEPGAVAEGPGSGGLPCDYASVLGALRACVKQGPDLGLKTLDQRPSLKFSTVSWSFDTCPPPAADSEGQTPPPPEPGLLPVEEPTEEPANREDSGGDSQTDSSESGEEDEDADEMSCETLRGDNPFFGQTLCNQLPTREVVEKILTAGRQSSVFRDVSTSDDARYLLSMFQEFSTFVLVDEDGAMTADVESFLRHFYGRYDAGPRWQLYLGIGMIAGPVFLFEPPAGVDSTIYPLIYSEKLGVKLNSYRGRNVTLHHTLYAGGLLYALATALQDDSDNPLADNALVGLDVVGLNLRRLVELNLAVDALMPVSGTGTWGVGVGLNLSLPLLDYFQEVGTP